MATPKDTIDTSKLGHVPYFLTAILSTPAGALPKGPLWVVTFDFDDDLKNTIRLAKSYEPQLPESWEIEKALATITTDTFQKTKGCVLAQSVNIPGESLITSFEGTQSNGFIRSRVGLGRQDFETLNISFLNTNVNFVDNVIRPWTIMTGHLGMIARPKEKKYRCNTVELIRLGVTSPDEPPVEIQKFNFYGVCPIAVESEQLTYDTAGNQTTKSASFAFQWYTVRSDKNSFALGEIKQELGKAGSTLDRLAPEPQLFGSPRGPVANPSPPRTGFR